MVVTMIVEVEIVVQGGNGVGEVGESDEGAGWTSCGEEEESIAQSHALDAGCRGGGGGGGALGGDVLGDGGSEEGGWNVGRWVQATEELGLSRRRGEGGDVENIVAASG